MARVPRYYWMETWVPDSPRMPVNQPDHRPPPPPLRKISYRLLHGKQQPTIQIHIVRHQKSANRKHPIRAPNRTLSSNLESPRQPAAYNTASENIPTKIAAIPTGIWLICPSRAAGKLREI